MLRRAVGRTRLGSRRIRTIVDRTKHDQLLEIRVRFEKAPLSQMRCAFGEHRAEGDMRRRDDVCREPLALQFCACGGNIAQTRLQEEQHAARREYPGCFPADPIQISTAVTAGIPTASQAASGQDVVDRRHVGWVADDEIEVARYERRREITVYGANIHTVQRCIESGIEQRPLVDVHRRHMAGPGQRC